MRAVRGAEGVVHVHVAQLRQLLRKFGIVLLLFRVVAEILEQQHLARLGHHRLHLRSDAIRRHLHGPAQHLREALCHRLQAHLRIRLALGPAEVAGQHQAGALLERVLDRRQRRLDALVGRNLLAAAVSGTLKSTRMNRRLPLRSRSRIDNFGMEIGILFRSYHPVLSYLSSGTLLNVTDR